MRVGGADALQKHGLDAGEFRDACAEAEEHGWVESQVFTSLVVAATAYDAFVGLMAEQAKEEAESSGK